MVVKRLSGNRAIWVIGTFFLLVSASIAQSAPRFYGEEVVVTAARRPQPAVSSPWNTTVIATQELQHFTTVGEVLRNVAGVDGQTYGYLGSLSSLRLRGANASQVLVMVDGQRLNSPTLGMVDANDLLLDNVERIEVVKSPLSALYGSDAVSGVINIIRRKTGNTLNVNAGSFGTQQYQVSLGSAAYYLMIDYLQADGFRRNGAYRAGNFYGQMSFGPWSLDIGYYDATKGVPGVPTAESDPASATEPNDRQTDKNSQASATLKGDDYQLKVYANQGDQKLDPYIWGASTNQTSRLAAEWQQTIGDWLYGIEAREDQGQTTMSGTHTIRNYAAFLQEAVALNDQLDITLGIRGDKHSTAGIAFSPRAGLVYQLTRDTFFKASAGSSFRAPTLNELYWNDGWMFGDPGLRPEKAFSYELGLEKRLGPGSFARVNYFSSLTTDLILWDWQSSTIETRAKNVGEAYSEGMEFELVRALGSRGQAFINYTYQQAVDRKDFDPLAEGQELRYTPRQKFNAGVVTGGTGIYLRHVGERYADQYNTIKLPGYTVVDLKFTSQQITLAVDNLFDERYSEAVGNDPTTFAVRNYPLPGRRYSLGVKLEF